MLSKAVRVQNKNVVSVAVSCSLSLSNAFLSTVASPNHHMFPEPFSWYPIRPGNAP